MRTETLAALAVMSIAALGGCDSARQVATASGSDRCATCHGNPPSAATGSPTTQGRAKVGAHDVHLAGGDLANAIACGSCHVVPSADSPEPLEHIDGSSAPAFTGVANTGFTSTYDEANLTCATYCHGQTLRRGQNTTPAWSDGPLSCTACHDPMFPEVSPPGNLHTFHSGGPGEGLGLACATCHAGYEADAVLEKALHVDGTVDVIVAGDQRITAADGDGVWAAESCTECHGLLGVDAD
jgi:predicted CxxxxCH...CXXCH cytochrome family protein